METLDPEIELKLLRAVYENARSVLRNNGVNKAAFERAMRKLDTSVENVKLLDSGLRDA